MIYFLERVFLDFFAFAFAFLFLEPPFAGEAPLGLEVAPLGLEEPYLFLNSLTVSSDKGRTPYFIPPSSTMVNSPRLSFSPVSSNVAIWPEPVFAFACLLFTTATFLAFVDVAAAATGLVDGATTSTGDAAALKFGSFVLGVSAPLIL